MKHIFYLATILLSPLISISQSAEQDSTSEQLITTWCDDIIFTKIEIPADFKYGKTSFENSLTRYLNYNNKVLGSGNADFSFVLAKNLKIYNVSKHSGHLENEKEIMKALSLTSNLWELAKQNNHPVCSYVRLLIEITDNKLTVTKH